MTTAKQQKCYVMAPYRETYWIYELDHEMRDEPMIEALVLKYPEWIV